MGGGLLQLVAYGAQDVYLTGNPQITLFKVVYRRHTNFSAECIEIPIDTAKPNGRVSVQVLRNGDLATKTYLRLAVPDLTTTSAFTGQLAWVRRLGHAVIKTAEIQIGGSPIDKHYGTWLDIWYELTHTVDQERGYKAMVGDVDTLTALQTGSSNTYSFSSYNLFVPLQFWFCRNYGLALPLIALQYHEVRINIEFEKVENLIVYTGSTAPTFSGGVTFGSSGLLIDYIYLDSEERRRFAQVGHEYLIEQVQYNESNLQNGTGGSETTQTFTLNFNHPCKELIWAQRVGAFNGANGASKFLAYTNKDTDADWNEQLRVAAENLIKSSFVGAYFGATEAAATTAARSGASVNASATFVGGTNGVQLFTLTVTTGAVTNVATTPIFVSTDTGSGCVFRVTELNARSVQAGIVAGSVNFYLINNAMVFGAYNPLNSIDSVSIEMTYVAQATGRCTSNTINVFIASDEHSLTLADLSTPVSKFTDYRISTVNDVAVVQLNNYGLKLDGKGNMVVTGNLVLNGHDRFAIREGNYFNYVQPAQHHTRTPADGINVYSFGLHPEQHQPSGTANMSRIDSARLVYKVKDTVTRSTGVTFDIYTGTVVLIYVTNYNILRIMSGMGGLAYSN